MAERMVQVSESLIKRARLVAELHGSSALRDELEALLSPPAPTVEQANDRYGHATPMAAPCTYYPAPKKEQP